MISWPFKNNKMPENVTLVFQPLVTKINFPFVMGNNYYNYRHIKVVVCCDSGKKIEKENKIE